MTVKWVGTREVPVHSLSPFPGNARRGDVEAIRESIRTFGQYRSLCVRDTGSALVILAGNHTWAALSEEAADVARCYVITCTDEEALRINLADNKLAELGGYDSAALAELLASLEGDFLGTGWTQEEYDALLEPEAPLGGNTDPDEAPDPPADPVTKPGDVWHLGPHRLLCGDATDMAAVERFLAGDRCDVMWTDPPYGVDYVGKTKDALRIQNDGASTLPELLDGAFAVATAALMPGAAVYVAHPAGPLSLEFGRAFVTAGWRFHEGLVWVKDVMVLGHADYHYRHEPILFGYTHGAEGRRGRGGKGWYGNNSQTSVFEVPKPSRSAVHPTMKPVALITPMLVNSCRPRGLVFEPFGGSGSTLIAAHQTARAARVVELDPVYCDVIVERFRNFTGIQPELAV